MKIVQKKIMKDSTMSKILFCTLPTWVRLLRIPYGPPEATRSDYWVQTRNNSLALLSLAPKQASHNQIMQKQSANFKLVSKLMIYEIT